MWRRMVIVMAVVWAVLVTGMGKETERGMGKAQPLYVRNGWQQDLKAELRNLTKERVSFGQITLFPRPKHSVLLLWIALSGMVMVLGAIALLVTGVEWFTYNRMTDEVEASPGFAYHRTKSAGEATAIYSLRDNISVYPTKSRFAQSALATAVRERDNQLLLLRPDDDKTPSDSLSMALTFPVLERSIEVVTNTEVMSGRTGPATATIPVHTPRSSQPEPKSITEREEAPKSITEQSISTISATPSRIKSPPRSTRFIPKLREYEAVDDVSAFSSSPVSSRSHSSSEMVPSVISLSVAPPSTALIAEDETDDDVTISVAEDASQAITRRHHKKPREKTKREKKQKTTHAKGKSSRKPSLPGPEPSRRGDLPTPTHKSTKPVPVPTKPKTLKAEKGGRKASSLRKTMVPTPAPTKARVKETGKGGRKASSFRKAVPPSPGPGRQPNLAFARKPTLFPPSPAKAKAEKKVKRGSTYLDVGAQQIRKPPAPTRKPTLTPSPAKQRGEAWAHGHRQGSTYLDTDDPKLALPYPSIPARKATPTPAPAKQRGEVWLGGGAHRLGSTYLDADALQIRIPTPTAAAKPTPKPGPTQKPKPSPRENLLYYGRSRYFGPL